MSSGSTAHILKSLAVNVTIGVAKGIAAVFTGSGAMLAETLHSFSDCANQLLLLLGVKKSAQAPTESHPLGYGRSMYFWSFIVALLLFSGGGVFSIYEGVHKLGNPEPVENVWLGLGILGFSLLLEGWATLGNLRDMKARRGDKPLMRYLIDTKDSDLVVVFGENSAAVVGLGLAIASLLASHFLNEPRYDAVGSIGVGLVLIAVAVFLGREVASLLLGERANPAIEETFRKVAKARPEVEEVLRVFTVQQGPSEVMVVAKLRFPPELTAGVMVDVINGIEKEVKEKEPEVRWSFVEPDHKP